MTPPPPDRGRRPGRGGHRRAAAVGHGPRSRHDATAGRLGEPAGGQRLRVDTAAGRAGHGAAGRLAAPVVDGQVIFSSAGSWDMSGVPTRAYHGPLAEIPGSGSYARAAAGGFRAVSLTTVERLISAISAK